MKFNLTIELGGENVIICWIKTPDAKTAPQRMKYNRCESCCCVLKTQENAVNG